ncbi:MAG: hypothetical protein ACT6FG_05710 [Methanosarcinaceae archaeon]
MTRIVGPLWKAIDDYVESLGDVIVNGKLGVGTDSPSQKLHIYDGASGGTPSAVSKVIIESASSSIIQFLSGVGSVQGIMFGDTSNKASGYIRYSHSDETLQISVGDTQGFEMKYAGGNIQNTQKGIMIHGQTPQTLTGAGAVDVTSAITHLVATGSPNAVTLADGAEGQEKTIILKTKNESYHASMLTPAHFANGSTIEFDAVGEIITLMFTNGAWHWTGGLGVTIA